MAAKQPGGLGRPKPSWLTGAGGFPGHVLPPVLLQVHQGVDAHPAAAPASERAALHLPTLQAALLLHHF